MRESSARGPAIDLSDFERRMRGAAPKPTARPDPLSELARLMPGEAEEADPYSRILPDPRSRLTPPPPPPSAAPSWDAHLRGSYDEAPSIAPEERYYEPDQGAHEHYDPRHDHHHGGHEHGYAEPGYGQEPAYGEEPAYGQEHYDHAHHGGAEGAWADDAHYLDYGADEGADADARGGLRRRLRPWHAVAVIAAVAVGSIAWGFLHRSGVGGSKEIAVINAPEGPVKVKPSAEADREAPNANGAAVLDRKEPSPVKQVVTHQEQAVDPTVAPKVVTLGDGPVDAPHEPAPQPRKIKTVTVRPDGSRVEGAALPPAAVATAAEPPAAEPAPPKAATTPKPQTKTATTSQAAKPKPAKVAATEPPAEQDAAAEATAASGGSYAVQFGAAASEEEARAMLKTVAQKYHVKPTFKPAKVGDKMVYRVRAAGLSKDSANAVCNKVKAGGGSCFVAGN